MPGTKTKLNVENKQVESDLYSNAMQRIYQHFFSKFVW